MADAGRAHDNIAGLEEDSVKERDRGRDREADVDEKQPTAEHDLSCSITNSTSSSSHHDDAPAAVLEETESETQRRTGVIPISKRRGLLAFLSVVPELENPRMYSRPVKQLLTFVVAVGGAGAPMASAVLFPALQEIADQLHSTPTLANTNVALYMLALAIFPLWWSSFAERWGRRSIYLISFTLYVASSVCGAVSVNIGMLIAFRIMSGASAGSCQSVGAGTIADIWDVKERGRAMGFFYLGPLCGPLLSPIIGGALTQRFGWRSTQWFLAIYGVIVLILMIFCLPETLHQKPRDMTALSSPTDTDTSTSPPIKLSRTVSRVSSKATKKTKEAARTLRIVLLDPLRALTYLLFPPVLLTVYWASMTFGCLYILNVSLQTTFDKAPYNFSTLIVGLTYIPSALGYITSSLLGGRWNDKIMHKAASARRKADPEAAPDEPLVFRPEDRMGLNAYIAGILFPLALLWYGWVVAYGVHWVAAMFATFTFGLGSMMVFSMATTMLTEFVPGRSSSAVAVNNFVRNIFSCVGGVVAEPIIAGIGNGWLFTILSIIGVLSMGVPVAMQRYGPGWRERARNGEWKFL